MENLDLMLVIPGGEKDKIYQELDLEFTAKVPPFWAVLVLGYIRKQGFNVGLIDGDGDGLGYNSIINILKEKSPKNIVVLVYGQQTNTSTPLMYSAINLSKELKKEFKDKNIGVMGRHVTALPQQSLLETKYDYLIVGEGFEALRDVLLGKKYQDIPSVYYKDEENNIIAPTKFYSAIKDLDNELFDIAWDLLDLKSNKYRSYNWQSLHDLKHRTNFAEFYTSLGCPYNCTFCTVSNFYGENSVRYWSLDWIMKQFDILVNDYGIKIINIMDELFILNKNHFMPIVEALIDKNYKDVSISVFARVNTLGQLTETELKKIKKAGINWIKLGIEASSEKNLDSVNKGEYTKDFVRNVVKHTRDAGINILADYMFGLPEDTYETMEENLMFALELNCEFAFFFPTMAFPGSKLYEYAVENGIDLPENWLGYSFQAYNIKPLPSKYLTPKQVLEYRDYAWNVYFKSPKYLNMIENKFGIDARKHIEKMSSIKLKRKLLGD